MLGLIGTGPDFNLSNNLLLYCATRGFLSGEYGVIISKKSYAA